MVEFSIRILLLSLLISAITAALVYLALHVLLVRPMRRMTANMVAFRADPENPARIIAASDRLDEIGTAERELAAMQLNSPRCCSRRTISPRSGWRCRRSTTTCATCCPRRSCSPSGWRRSPIRMCSASHPS